MTNENELIDVIAEKIWLEVHLLTIGQCKLLAQDILLTVKAAQQSVQATGLWDCANCENRQIGAGFDVCPNCDTPRH